MTPQPPVLSKESRNVLRYLMGRKMASGWELASVVGGPDKIGAAVEPLMALQLVDFTPELDNEEKVLKSYINLKPSAIGLAERYLYSGSSAA